MKTRIVAAIGLLLLLNTSASAVTETFSAILSGDQEAPTPVVSAGTGTGTAIYDSVANTLEVDVSFSGLGSNTNNAHIHCCASLTTSAGVALDFVAPGFPIGVTSGAFSHTFDLGQTSTYTNAYLSASGGTADAARDRLLDSMRRETGGNLGIAYFNIHTDNNPPGEIRGNISLIPEPTAMLLLAIGVLPLAAFRRAR
jgi:hypothetical protein